jgi:hypothetical protein
MNRKFPTNAKPPTFRKAAADRLAARLMLLIIFQAVRDAEGRDDVTPEQQADAIRFLRSEDFEFFCDYLGIRPSLKRRILNNE